MKTEIQKIQEMMREIKMPAESMAAVLGVSEKKLTEILTKGFIDDDIKDRMNKVYEYYAKARDHQSTRLEELWDDLCTPGMWD